MEKTTMSVQELSSQMGISLPKAYELVRNPPQSEYMACATYRKKGKARLDERRFP